MSLLYRPASATSLAWKREDLKAKRGRPRNDEKGPQDEANLSPHERKTAQKDEKGPEDQATLSPP